MISSLRSTITLNWINLILSQRSLIHNKVCMNTFKMRELTKIYVRKTWKRITSQMWNQLNWSHRLMSWKGLLSNREVVWQTNATSKCMMEWIRAVWRGRSTCNTRIFPTVIWHNLCNSWKIKHSTSNNPHQTIS